MKTVTVVQSITQLYRSPTSLYMCRVRFTSICTYLHLYVKYPVARTYIYAYAYFACASLLSVHLDRTDSPVYVQPTKEPLIYLHHVVCNVATQIQPKKNSHYNHACILYSILTLPGRSCYLAIRTPVVHQLILVVYITDLCCSF